MHKKKHILKNTIYIIVLLLITAFVIMPIVLAISNSLRYDYSDIFAHSSKLSIYTLFPEHVNFQHYKELLIDNSFWRPVLNSLIVAICTVICGFLVNGLAGFAFAKYNFRGKNILFTIFLFSFMIPFEVIAIPLYKTTDAMGLLNTRLALILPMIGNGMIVFLYRQFFKEIPDSLIESAVIDGAGPLKIFFWLLVPLSKPVIISASLMMFIQQWDAFLWPMVAASSKELKVVQVAISELYGETFTDWTLIYAATVIAILIPVSFILPLQKYYIRGVAGTGVKE
jgi:multiple sugar transport system permease protein/putative chitobiose transport system permease protein